MLEERLIWRTSFIVVALGVISLAVALSIFFYVRSREPIWDNRSRTARITAINPNSGSLGSEFFTMFSTSSGQITLNGKPIQDENSIYIRQNGNFIIEISGTNTELAAVHSKLFVSRTGGTDQVTPLDANSSTLSSVSVQLNSLTTPGQTIVATLVGNRLELTSATSTSYRCGVRVLVGWYSS
jgi:hypothetical protein